MKGRAIAPRSVIWLTIYLALVVVPLGLAFLAPRPAPAGFAWDFAMALGYAAVAMMGVQFVLTARFKRACAPYGIDVVYYFHRYLALTLLALVAGHAIAASIIDPASVGPVNPSQASLYISLGRLSLLSLVVIVISSWWRKRLRLEYDHWRIGHALLAVLALLAAVIHVEGAASYLIGAGKHIAWMVLTLVWLLVIMYVRVLRPLRLLRRPYQVTNVQREAGRSWTLSLAPKGHAGFAFQPGQFAWLSLRASPFALREHPFSLASNPSADGRVTFTIKALGDFTATVDTIKPGETAYVDGPYGAFSCDRYADARGLIFVAGGVGIAPMMSMLRALAERGDQRPLLLYYGNRIWSHVLFRDELTALAARLNLDVIHILGEPPADWLGESGLLSGEILARHLPLDTRGWHAFVCGPTPMIQIAERELIKLALPARSVHSEIFDLA